MKSKGLQKLRWYCQLCNKQCRNENGFICHQMTAVCCKYVGLRACDYLLQYSLHKRNLNILSLHLNFSNQGHKRMMAVFGENPNKFIDGFSLIFEKNFLEALKNRY